MRLRLAQAPHQNGSVTEHVRAEGKRYGRMVTGLQALSKAAEAVERIFCFFVPIALDPHAT
jgi:hypothetical protein